MKWVVKIEGEQFILKELTRSLNPLKLSVFQEGENYFLSCDDFNSSENAEEVFEEAKKLVPILSGVAQIELGHPLRLGNVFRKNDDGTLQEFGFAWTEEPLLLPKIIIRASDNKAQVSNIADNVKVWVETAQKDNKVTEALTLLGSTELNWVILYKILEIVKRDIRTKIHEKGWITKTDEDRFTQTAQPYRHAKHSERVKKWKPHNKPMMFYEAKTFIRTILSNWLRSKEKR